MATAADAQGSQHTVDGRTMVVGRAAAYPLATPRPLPVVSLSIAGGVLAGAVTVLCLADVDLGYYVTSGVSLITALAAAGLAVFQTALPPASAEVRERLTKLTVGFAAAGFLTALLFVAWHVMHVSGLGVRGLADATSQRAVLRGGSYTAALVRCVGLVGVVVAVTARVRRARSLALAGAIVACGSLLITGHARTHGPAAVVMPALLAHVLAAALWFGGLLALGVTLRDRGVRRGPAGGHLVATFAALMTGVIGMLIAGGLALSFVYLPSAAALVDTAYGRVLLIKLALGVGILAVAGLNHRRLVPRAAAGDRRAVRTLTMTVTVEQISLLAVLAITAVLANQSPGG